MKTVELYKLFEKATGVSIDTRTIHEGDMFFAIKGPNFDGHKYIRSALEAGASYAVSEDDSIDFDERVILVKSTIKALQNLAVYHRCNITIPVVGITGSNGKTTTKELMTSVLQTKFNVFSTKGNYNNHLGVPLSILSIKEEHELAIIEMGANHQGEIKFLSEISMPDFGLITNIGKAHLEGFGGLEGVRKGKTELYRYISKTNGKIFYNTEDQKLVESLPNGIETFSYSADDVKQVADFPSVIIEYKDVIIESNLTGSFNIINMVAAMSVGSYFGLELNQLKEGIEAYIPSNNRSQTKHTERNILIMDAYNANPSSMTESIKNFSKYPNSNKTLIIGHMLELGDSSEQEHVDLINFISTFKWTNVFLVGEEFMRISDRIPFEVFINTETLSIKLVELKLSGHAILLKGSRGVALEKCIHDL